jgi:hypothetical protein
MTFEIEQWLAPMLAALLECMEGPDSFARFFETAVAQASADVPSETVLAEMFGQRGDGGRINSVDWVRLGNLMRDRLGWDEYPSFPANN